MYLHQTWLQEKVHQALKPFGFERGHLEKCSDEKTDKARSPAWQVVNPVKAQTRQNSLLGIRLYIGKKILFVSMYAFDLD